MSKSEVHSVADFIKCPLWDQAQWSGTTFRSHPTGNAPPVLGLCFENALPAQELFSRWTESIGGTESLWVSIVEGEISGQQPGYSIHISLNPKPVVASLEITGGVADTVLLAFPGRINRMQIAAGSPSLLPKFKRDYNKFREFLLAPVVRRGNGQLWFDIELGIVQTNIHFRSARDIDETDFDSPVIRPLTVPLSKNVPIK